MLAGSSWLVPLARRRLAAAGLADAAVLAVGIGASLGGLSLWMLLLGLLPGAWLLPALVLPVPWLGLALQLWPRAGSTAPRNPDASRSVVYIANGYVHAHDLYLIAALFAIGFVGSYIGKRLLEKISETQFKNIVLILILLVGLATLTKLFVQA